MTFHDSSGVFHLILINSFVVTLCQEASNGPLTIVTEADIFDRSKSNFIAKAFVILQSIWLVVRVFATKLERRLIFRHTTGLSTVACVFCAIVVYCFWQYEPSDVEHVTVVKTPTSIISGESKPWTRRTQVRGERQQVLLLAITYSILKKGIPRGRIGHFTLDESQGLGCIRYSRAQVMDSIASS